MTNRTSRTRRKRPTLVLETLGDCDRLTRLALFAHPWGGISVRIPALDDVTRKSAELRLNSLYRECGCHAGALAATLALAAVVSGRFAGWLPDLHGVARVLAELTLFGAAAVIGKLSGLMIGRQRLSRYAEVVHHQLHHLVQVFGAEVVRLRPLAELAAPRACRGHRLHFPSQGFYLLFRHDYYLRRTDRAGLGDPPDRRCLRRPPPLQPPHHLRGHRRQERLLLKRIESKSSWLGVGDSDRSTEVVVQHSCG